MRLYTEGVSTVINSCEISMIGASNFRQQDKHVFADVAHFLPDMPLSTIYYRLKVTDGGIL